MVNLIYVKSLSPFICIAFLAFTLQAQAQKITGTWEGGMEGEFLQVNVVQKGNALCGYTFDYELRDRSSFCRAVFEGIYDEERQLWYLSGRQFISNSGSHVLMRIILQKDPEGNRNKLVGMVFTAGAFSGSPLTLTRVSPVPEGIGKVMPPCFPVKQKPVAKAPVKPSPKPVSPEKPDIKRPVAKKPASPAPKPAPIKKVPVAPVKPASPEKPLDKKTIEKPAPLPEKKIVQDMKLRKRTEQNRLIVSVNKINLKVYDNGIVDGDTVSIFYNGKLLLAHRQLSETPIVIDLDLDPGVSLHEITMYAENLGSIPPNTALIVVTAGDKRYELRSKASLEENAVLVIEYKPLQ